jgi:hypothetical protein
MKLTRTGAPMASAALFVSNPGMHALASATSA